MRCIISVIAFCLVGISSNAQYDDKFYYPKKEWNEIHDSVDCKEVNFEVVEGQNINALILEPKGEFKNNIIFFHGAGGNGSTYLFMTQPLAELGYRIIMVDVRGYGKSDGIPTHVGIAEDAPKVFDYLLGLEDLKGSKPIIYGASMGTQIAAHLAAQVNDKITLLVLDGPMSSFTDIAAHSAPKMQKLVIKQFVTSPYSAKEDVSKVSVPILVIHSRLDRDIPFEQAEEVYANSNEPKLFWEYQGDHLMAAKLLPKTLDEKIQALIAD